MSGLLVGIDVGTTQTKGVLIDVNGGILAVAQRESTLQSRHPAWAEEDPEQWWRNTGELVRELLQHNAATPGDIAGVGVSGMVPAMVLLADDGSLLRPSIQQNDARAGSEVDDLAADFGQQRFFDATGGSINQQVVAPKMRWLARNEPDVIERLATLMGSYDYINFRLTGERSVERNWLLEAGFMDIRRGERRDDLVALAGLSADQLPSTVKSHEKVGEVSDQAARATGLLAGTPVFGGAADHVASAYVTTAYEPGDLVVKFGGAGDILYAQQDLVTDARLFIDYHLVPGQYFLNGCMATSGSLVRWFVERFAVDVLNRAGQSGTSAYRLLDQEAEVTDPGASGVVVLPYFLGEKTPIHDPKARGTILGLGLHHDRAHLYRAILEAVAFGFRHHVDVIEERGLTVNRVLAADGGAQSDLWMQITADVLQRPVTRLERHPGSSLGSAVAAGIGSGVLTDWRAIESYVALSKPFEPRLNTKHVYDANYDVYRTSYARLKDVYQNASTQGGWIA